MMRVDTPTFLYDEYKSLGEDAMFARVVISIALLWMMLNVGTPVSSDIGADCPTTSPNGIGPSGERSSATWYYQNGMYVGMDGDGVIHAKTEDGGKTGWIKAIVYHDVDSSTFDVQSRFLGSESSGMEVDADINPAFGRETPIHVGGITFPSDGCWKLTYSTENASMTFVVVIRFVEEWSATPAG